MGMVTENQQMFWGLVENLKNAFKSRGTRSELVSEFYSQTQKTNESEDVCVDDLKIIVQKIIAQKSIFQGNLSTSTPTNFWTCTMQGLFIVLYRCKIVWKVLPNHVAIWWWLLVVIESQKKWAPMYCGGLFIYSLRGVRGAKSIKELQT